MRHELKEYVEIAYSFFYALQRIVSHPYSHCPQGLMALLYLHRFGSTFVLNLFKNNFMIKKLMILGVSLACLTACNNDNDFDSNEVELVNVKFNVNALSVDVQPMAKTRSVGTRASARDVLTDIQYHFFNTKTSERTSGTQSIGADANFGEFSVMLPPGNYNAIFLGNTANNKGGLFTISFGGYISSETAFSVNDKEVFYHKTTYDISNSGQSEEVGLSRLVGKLVLQLTDDDIPSDISRISANIEYLPRFKPMYNQSATSAVGNAGWSTRDLTFSSNNIDVLEIYYLPHTSRKIILTVYGSDNSVLASTEVQYSIYSNKRTIVQGKLFDIINSRDFNVTVSDEWDEDVIIPLQ